MKTTVAPYETAVWCLRIECVNGTVVRLAVYPYDLKMSNGQVYEADNGYETTAYTATNSMAPSAIDIDGLAGLAGISRDMLASGVFDNARIKIFRTSWLAPVEDQEEVAAGFFGKTTLQDERYKVEGMSLADALNQSSSVTVTPGCRHTFGGAMCSIALAPLTVTGTLTHVTSGYSFRDSARAETADTFSAGTIRFTSGANSGLKALEIKSHAADGSLVVHESCYYTPSVGDAYEMIPGCRKSRDACKARSNIVNFGGFPDVPLNSTYTKIGTNF